MLYIVPVPIDTESKGIPPENIQYIHSIKYWAVENIKTARRMLRKMGFKLDFNTEVSFFELDKHSKLKDYAEVTAWFKSGHSVGLMSEAGVPCIADPGYEIVLLAHSLGIEVSPLVGPSSILLAVMASGLSGQSFAFNGYLPIEKAEKLKKLKHLEAISAHQSQFWMETPYRNNEMLMLSINSLSSDSLLSLAVDILSENQYFKTQTISQWRAEKNIPNIHKKLCIFGLGK